MKKKILYIEDEPYLGRIVRETLTLKGYEVLHKKDGTRLADVIRQFNPDVCLLDVMLPHIDGFTLGNLARNLFPQLPVIFLTAKSQTEDLVQGFASGGTDYIRKPFSMDELMARIENQLRLQQQKKDNQPELPEEVSLNAWRFYPGKLELHFGAEVKRLSQRESQILSMLCLHRDKALDRRLLLQTVWGDDSFFNSRNLDVYIRKLRAFFAADDRIQIITLKGQGYLFICG
ncbi:response regulator transcription factor [Taibaiella koreensis]|uniref:response regulator transcription factor n=1 Tax=Taibaiella koreensis TaxID=1268548 RepID=UPI000E599CC1|nr:response regulator transcription factor [Taibaiella koreensis]